jgi:hypothetical protein
VRPTESSLLRGAPVELLARVDESSLARLALLSSEPRLRLDEESSEDLVDDDDDDDEDEDEPDDLPDEPPDEPELDEPDEDEDDDLPPDDEPPDEPPPLRARRIAGAGVASCWAASEVSATGVCGCRWAAMAFWPSRLRLAIVRTVYRRRVVFMWGSVKWDHFPCGQYKQNFRRRGGFRPIGRDKVNRP